MQYPHTESFDLLAIREDKQPTRTHFVGVNGETATAFDVTGDRIQWHVNDEQEVVTVKVITNDTPVGVTSSARVEGPREQLDRFLKELDFVPVPQ